MSTITINEIEYNFDDLNEEAKTQVLNLQFVQSELQSLNAKIAVYKTAEISYSKALKNELPVKD